MGSRDDGLLSGVEYADGTPPTVYNVVKSMTLYRFLENDAGAIFFLRTLINLNCVSIPVLDLKLPLSGN